MGRKKSGGGDGDDKRRAGEDRGLQVVRGAIKNAVEEPPVDLKAERVRRSRAQRSVGGRKGAAGGFDIDKAAEAFEPVPFSEDQIAQDASEQLGERWKYIMRSGTWLHYDGARYAPDETDEIRDTVRHFVRTVAVRCDNKRVAASLSSSRTVASVIKFLGADRRHRASLDDFDRDPWLVNTTAGVVDLRSGKLAPHHPNYRMSKITRAGASKLAPFHPNYRMSASRWLQFVDQVTLGNKPYARYLAQAAGYSFSGSVREHKLFFLFGAAGANGKSTFVDVLRELAGDYGGGLMMEALTIARGERHPTELASLIGKRLVTISETNAARPWDEARLKAITGGEKIEARFIRTDVFEFAPQFKLWITGNHLPPIKDIDGGLKRRVVVLPFDARFSVLDPNLKEKLLEERDGIMDWIRAGALDYCLNGLMTPDVVRKTTEEYFAEEDFVGAFLAERRAPASTYAQKGDLWADFKAACDAAGVPAGTSNKFGRNLRQRGYVPGHHPKARVVVYYGLQAKLHGSQGSFGYGADHDSDLDNGGCTDAPPDPPRH